MVAPSADVIRREMIRDRLYLARIKQADIAREEGVSRGLVCHVMAGRRSHLGVRKALAKACRLTMTQLWG